MRSRGLLMLVVALIAGLAAVVLAMRWMQQQGGLRTQVAVANVDIEIGARVGPEMVRLTDWPEGSVPPGAFKAADELVGRVVVTSVLRGEPLIESRLAPVGTKGGLSAVVREGKRAMTVRVNDVVGVAGFALPGTYVDVMVNTQIEGAKTNEKDRTISKIVLERILVMAVAQEADRDTTKPKVVNAVTLELTPGQAELLDLARSVGTLSLVLRNQTETASTDTEGVTKAELLGLKEQAPAPAPAPAAPVRRAAAPKPVTATVAKAEPAPLPRPTNCVEVIRGLTKVTECF
jgi:pilus assembly protein CpaB